MMIRRTMCLTLVLGFATATPADAQETIEFNRDVRPILANHCFTCHGADAGKREADLRLDLARTAMAPRDGKSAIVPGSPDSSVLWQRIISDDPDLVMPPPSTKKALSGQQREILRRWIEQGASYQAHWAFEPISAPEPPRVSQSQWARNPIDQFVLQRLELEQLQPREEADRSTLIRRVAFTLTGLPPTLNELDAFLQDRQPGAYERMVDRFLDSRHYGEEMARHWLDVARYADTHGLHLDNEREMWAYRDWVIRSFNQNLPFDEFTTWQLAGDLLPNPTLDQRIATGFNRCNVSTSEGGSIASEWVYRYAVDRTTTMAQTWMGLTAGCAVCHDHKYDPLSMHEFYSMYAFFYSASDPGMDGNIRNTNPFIQVPTARQREQLEQLQQRERELLRKFVSGLDLTAYRDPAAARMPGTGPSPPPLPEQAAASQTAGTTSQRTAVNDSLIDDDFPRGAQTRNTSRNDAQWALDPEFGTVSGRRCLELANADRFDVSIQLTLIPVIVPEQGRFEFSMRTDPYYPPRAISIHLNDGRNHKVFWGDRAELGGADHEPVLGPVPAAGEWTRVSIPFADLGVKPGAQIRTLVLQQTGGRLWFDDLRIAGQIDPRDDPRSSLHAFWSRSKGQNPSDLPAELKQLLTAGPVATLSSEQSERLVEFYLTHIQRLSESPASEPRQAWEAAARDRVAFSATIPGTMVFTDLDQPRDAFVMLRGQYDKPGDAVQPGVPEVLPALRLSASEPAPTAGESRPRANRLDLARWLVSDEHPLTARVTVNRFWQQVFGNGLVKTSDDFGTRGDLPSHPELLDWLAADYRSHGWDTRRLMRMMLTSATFRQSSRSDSELNLRDPENRLLARGPRFRLDAEQLRDNALFVGGLLNSQMGGRGVLPYQPPNIWEPVGYENSNTRFYMQDHGSDLYRRSIYCFLKRTAPPPFMSNFDAPNREQFCTRRERSNTPLQALQLMNDVQHFEAARALAERTLEQAGPTPEERIRFLYRVVLSRQPDRDELRLVEAGYREQLKLFQESPQDAQTAIRTGESDLQNIADAPQTAAWTLIANMLLNLDETISRN